MDFTADKKQEKISKLVGKIVENIHTEVQTGKKKWKIQEKMWGLVKMLNIDVV